MSGRPLFSPQYTLMDLSSPTGLCLHLPFSRICAVSSQALFSTSSTCVCGFLRLLNAASAPDSSLELPQKSDVDAAFTDCGRNVFAGLRRVVTSGHHEDRGRKTPLRKSIIIKKYIPQAPPPPDIILSKLRPTVSTLWVH